MEHLPLVGAEVRRIGDAFRTVALELSAVQKVLDQRDYTSVGTPGCDPAVHAGMRDLQSALAALHLSASDCVVALTRHGELAPPSRPPYPDESAEAGHRSDEVER